LINSCGRLDTNKPKGKKLTKVHGHMAPELHEACFMNILKMVFNILKKSKQKNLDVDNNEIYGCAKNQTKFVVF
jgi:hypothetical protein